MLFEDDAPLGQRVPGLIISLGYNNSYQQREYAPWQEFCSGLPFVVYSEKYGRLTRDMLRDPKAAHDLDEYAVAGLIEAITYELTRSSRGEGGVRQLYYNPVPYQLIGAVNPGHVTFFKENLDRLRDPATAFNDPNLEPIDLEKIDFRRLFTYGEFPGLNAHFFSGYWPDDFEYKPETVYYPRTTLAASLPVYLYGEHYHFRLLD